MPLERSMLAGSRSTIMSTVSRDEDGKAEYYTTFKSLFWENKYPTITYWLLFGLVGMSSTYLGPCLETMRCQVHASEKFMTVVFAVQLFSMLFGTVIAGLLNKIIAADLLLSVSGCVLVISTATLGFSHSVETFLPILTVNGLSTGFIDNLCNIQMINLFGEKVGPFMQAMHFMFAIAAFLVLLISGPFISLGYKSCEELNEGINGTETTFSLTPLYGIISGLEVPAVICVVVLAILGTWRCVGYRHNDDCDLPPLSKRESYTELQEKEKTQKTHAVFLGIIILVLAVLMAFIADGIQGEYNGYIFEYSIKVLHDDTTKEKAAYLTCCFWAFFALGRLLSIFVATKLKTNQILIVALVGLTVSCLPLILLPHNIVTLFCESALFGLFLSNAVPGIFTLAEETIDLTRCKVTALVMGSALGEACMPLIVGTMVNNVKPIAFPLFNFVVVMLIFILFTILNYLGSLTRKGSYVS